MMLYCVCGQDFRTRTFLDAHLLIKRPAWATEHREREQKRCGFSVRVEAAKGSVFYPICMKAVGHLPDELHSFYLPDGFPFLTSGF